MKRLAEFLRSVIPQDSVQLLFLAGTVCLVIAPRLRWWPVGVEIFPEHAAHWLNPQLGPVRGLILFPSYFAGIAAYFIAFWPGPRPVRRILSCIYLPALPMLAVLCWSFLDIAGPYRSVLEPAGSRTNWTQFPFLRLPGLQFCLAGLLLIGIFTRRLILGRSSLPLRLPAASLLRDDHPEIWRHTQILIWAVIGPLFFTTTFIVFPLMFSFSSSRYVQKDWFSSLCIAAEMLLVLAAAIFIIGKSAAPMLRRALRVPGEKSVLLAATFSIGIPVLIAAGQYLSARASWARGDLGVFAPELDAYFHFPPVSLLLLLFPALYEEIIFRGFLQPRLTQRYGLHRGIFLVGIVWAAFHFPSDFSFSHFSVSDVILKIASRSFVCIAHSFVFGWLALETGSVLAAALAHTFYNVLLYSDLGPPFVGKNWLRLALWAALACLLFRYWPIKRASRLPEPARVTKSIEPAQSAPAQPSPEPENP